MRSTIRRYIENLKTVKILEVPNELKNNELFFQDTYVSQNFRYGTLKSPFL